MKRIIIIGLLVLVCISTVCITAYADSFSMNDRGELVGPEAYTYNAKIKTSGKWRVYCSYANGDFRPISGKGDATVKFTMYANSLPDASYVNQFAIMNETKGMDIGYREIIQAPLSIKQRFDQLCRCGEERSFISTSSFYRANYVSMGYYRKAFQLNPEFSKDASKKHGVVINNGAFYCRNCDAELDHLFVIGLNYESDDTPILYENHSLVDGVCTACGYVPGIKTTGLKLSMPEGKTLFSGDSATQLNVTRIPADSNTPIVFSSNNTAIATVDRNTGLVTPIGTGKKINATVKITAKTATGVSTSITLTITNPDIAQRLFLNQSGTIAISMDRCVLLHANAYPSTAKNTIYWKSSRPEIATVVNGEISPVAPTVKIGKKTYNSTVITAMTDNGKKASITVVVRSRTKPTSIAIVNEEDQRTPLSVSLMRTEQRAFSVQFYPLGCTDVVTWSSSNSKTVSVDKDTGIITAKKSGSAVISVKAGNLSAQVLINVRPLPGDIKAINIGDNFVVRNDRTRTIPYELIVENSDSNSAPAISASVADKTIVSVNLPRKSAGLEKLEVTGLSEGTTTITLRAGNNDAPVETRFDVKVIENSILLAPVRVGNIGPGWFDPEYKERWKADHHGIDINGNDGCNVYAAESGTVEKAEFSATLGYHVVIKFNQVKTSDGKPIFANYLHLSSITTSKGATVEAGAIIGKVGGTGSYASGSHLHFALSHGVLQSYLDPVGYLPSDFYLKGTKLDSKKFEW